MLFRLVGVVPSHDQVFPGARKDARRASDEFGPDGTETPLRPVGIERLVVIEGEQLIRQTREGDHKIVDVDAVRVNAGDMVKVIAFHEILDAVFDGPSALVFLQNSLTVEAVEGIAVRLSLGERTI